MDLKYANTGRLDVVDALRGFAIASILVLHNLEHFDYSFFPEYLPAWLQTIDKYFWDTMFFLFGGKSYSIFALLFGFTFFIQDSHQQLKGNDFRSRFAWRLLWLFLFSVVNSIFFQGDILTFFAVFGLFLIPVCRLSDKWVLAIMIFLLLQPYELGSLIALGVNPDASYHMTNSPFWFHKTHEFFEGASIPAMMRCDLSYGKWAVILWNFENGRMFQMPALFMAGMLLGRRGLFVPSEESRNFWKKAALWGFVAFAVFFLLKNCKAEFFARPEMNRIATKLFGFWSNLGFTALLIGLFVSLYNLDSWKKALDIFAPLGKMSLTNYMFSSVFGFFVYYGCGLGLYKFTGATMSFFIGLILVAGLWWFCTLYGRNHKRGPLEQLWHKLTWIKF